MNLAYRLVTLLAFAPSVLAQTAPEVPVLGPDVWSAPLHRITSPGGADALRGAGPTYKATFGEAFAFYPLLGSDVADNLPVRWRTVQATVASEVLWQREARAERVSDRRVEWDRGAFVERYDLRDDGVEQSFVFHRVPARRGELVITGRLDTTLTAATAGAAHQQLVFADTAGVPRVRYGEAIAFDSRGQRIDVTTEWDGELVRLRVPADFVERAEYPLTVDPLTSSVGVDSGTAPVIDMDVIRDPGRTSASILVVFSRVFAGNDTDAYAVVMDADFQNPTVVYSDLGPSTNTSEGQCAFVGDTQKWVAVYEREFPSSSTSSVVVYLHAQGNATANSGSEVILSKPAGSTARNPDVSGRHAGGGNNCFVVYQTDQTTTQENTQHTEVWGVLVNTLDAAEASVPTTLDWFAVGTTYDREHPTVAKMHGAPGFWIVAWHELHIPSVQAGGDDWDINVTRVSYTGRKQAQRYRFGPGAHPWNKRFPQLQGVGDRYVLTYVFGPNGATPTAQEVHAQRFDWPAGVFDPVMFTENVLASDASTPDFAFPRIAADSNTESHWAITYQRGTPGDLYVARIGFQAKLVETQTVFSSGSADSPAAAVTFSPENGGSFPVVYATSETGDPLYGRALTYPATAVNTVYGTGCGIGSISASRPYRGDQFFTVSLTGAAPNQSALLGFSASSNALSLAAVPMPGCFLNVGAPSIWVGAATDPLGDASVTFPIFEGIPGGSTVYFQWLNFGSQVTPNGLETTQGLSSTF